MLTDSAQLSPRRTHEEPSRSRMLSPELALVDDELGAWARLRLQEDAVAAQVAAVAAVEPSPERRSVEEVEPDRHARSLVPLAVATAVAAAVIAAVAVALRPSSGDSSKPAASSDGSSTHGAPAVSPPKPTPAAEPSATVPFAWPSVSAARGYVFTLSRGSNVIYRARTTAEQLHLKRSWKYRGHRFRLTRGAYRWSVTALVGSRSGRPRTVVSAPFWIDGSS